MSNTNTHSLHTLPVELVYRVLDKLSLYEIVCSMLNVCTRLNAIVNSYHRDEVSFIYESFILFCYFDKKTYRQNIFLYSYFHI